MNNKEIDQKGIINASEIILLNEEDAIRIYQKKAKFFQDLKQKVHLTLKNKRFANGFILYIGADFLTLYEKNGFQSPIFYLEILDITRFTTLEESIKMKKEIEDENGKPD